jgi:hypothetical protein
MWAAVIVARFAPPVHTVPSLYVPLLTQFPSKLLVGSAYAAHGSGVHDCVPVQPPRLHVSAPLHVWPACATGAQLLPCATVPAPVQ